MKVCGLIAEYDPFHNGHAYHMEEARRRTGADYVIVVMSGDFVQRGTPAVIDKYERTLMALRGGADLVLELPALFATSGAEIFGSASAALLHKLGVVTHLCFGSECGDLQALDTVADCLLRETPEFKAVLRDALKNGEVYPAAREKALIHCLGTRVPELSEMLKNPNNILALEYLKALKRLGSPIAPVTVKRWKADYHSDRLSGNVASASALRKILISEDSPERLSPFVPDFTADAFAANHHRITPVTAGDFSPILQYRMFSEMDHLDEYLDFTKDLAERVKNLYPLVHSFDEWADALKTRAYTRTHICRALLHLVLNMKKDDPEKYRAEDYCAYARVLGFRKESSPLFTEIKTHSDLPLVTKVADAVKSLPEKAAELLLTDVFSRDVYRSQVYSKYRTELRDEYTRGIIII